MFYFHTFPQTTRLQLQNPWPIVFQGCHTTSSSATMAASRSGSVCPAEASFYARFHVECDPKPPNLPPFVHHESKVDKRGDGLHLRLYMAGVGKENLKVRIEGGELIAQGIKDKGFEDKDDTSIVTTRYKLLSPPVEVYNLDGIKAEINNGMLKVFVPRRNPEVDDPTKRPTKFYQEFV